MISTYQPRAGVALGILLSAITLTHVVAAQTSPVGEDRGAPASQGSRSAPSPPSQPPTASTPNPAPASTAEPTAAGTTPPIASPSPAQAASPADDANGHGHKSKKKNKAHDDDAQAPDNGDGAEGSRERNGGAEPGDPWGEEHGGAEFGVISLRGMVQARYASTFAKASTNVRPDYVVRENNLAQQGDGWALNRFFLRMSGEPTEYVGLKAILDFAELADNNADGTVKQAYGTVKAIPKRLKFVAGLFKLPFSTMELDPIARYELADLGQSDALIKDLGYGGRDLGAQAIISPLADPDWLRLMVGSFRGHSHDENDFLLGTIGARLESEPLKGLRLGLDVVAHTRDTIYQRPFDTKKKDVLINPSDPFYPTQKNWGKGQAWSADISFERYHFAARAEAMLGDRVDLDSAYGARTFGAVWGLLGYRFHAGPLHLMPALRAEWLDGDREHKTGLRRQLSAAINLLISKNARVLFDVTRSDVEKGSPLLDQPKPLQVPPYLDLSFTRLVGQLQIEM